MFRIDDEFIIDATLAGGLARYINHSCDPNCSTKILPYNDDKKIIIIANRPVKAGEEVFLLSYSIHFFNVCFSSLMTINSRWKTPPTKSLAFVAHQIATNG